MLPLSLLNDCLYCPRRAALKLVEGWREANQHTERGDIVHENAVIQQLMEEKELEVPEEVSPADDAKKRATQLALLRPVFLNAEALRNHFRREAKRWRDACGEVVERGHIQSNSHP